jgi:hypothetical protein
MPAPSPAIAAAPDATPTPIATFLFIPRFDVVTNGNFAPEGKGALVGAPSFAQQVA